MRIETFYYFFKRLDGIKLNDTFILYHDAILNLKTGKFEYTFKRFKPEMLKYTLSGVTIKELIDKLTREDLKVVFDGGRGSSSGSEGTFKFNHASGGGGNEGGGTLPPAKLNVMVKNAEKNPDNVLKAFRKLHVNSDHEFGAIVDGEGFVTSYIEGGATSVSIWTDDRNSMVYHNHPSGGAFSDSDLLSVSQTGAKGIVASGVEGDYIFVKTNHFQPSKFARAVKNAQMKGKDYNDARRKWLKANESKYGYKFEFRKA